MPNAVSRVITRLVARNGSPRRATPLRERIIEGALFGCGALSVFVTAGILLVLVFETFAFFSEVSIGDFLTDTVWTPLFSDAHFGI